MGDRTLGAQKKGLVVDRKDRAVAAVGSGKGAGKAVKEALRSNPPDILWADEIRDLREWLAPTSRRSR
jgi:hypothetical protein